MALSASKDKLQVCANILTILDRLVDNNAKIEQLFASQDQVATTDMNRRKEDKARQKEVEARFDILKSLAQANDIAFRDILEKLTEHAMNMSQQGAVGDDRGKQVAARVVQLVSWQIARLDQGKGANDWNFKTYLIQIEKIRRVSSAFPTFVLAIDVIAHTYDDRLQGKQRAQEELPEEDLEDDYKEEDQPHEQQQADQDEQQEPA